MKSERFASQAEPADCDAGDLAEPDLQFLRVMAGGESNFLRRRKALKCVKNALKSFRIQSKEASKASKSA